MCPIAEAVEAVVLEWKRLGIAFTPLDLDVGLGTAFTRNRDQARRKVQASHPRPEFRRRDCGVSGSAGDIEHVHARLDGCPRHQDIADGGHLLGHRPVITRAPHVLSHGAKLSPLTDDMRVIRRIRPSGPGSP
jgi:hypothetical protein